MNLGNLKAAIEVLLLLIAGVFLVRIYWTDIVTILGGIFANSSSPASRTGGEPLSRVKKHWGQLHKSVIAVLLLSSGVWIIDIIRLKLIDLALNLPQSLHLIATVSILYLVLGNLPITPGGLGVVEGVLIYILLYFGLPLTSASSFVFLERLISFGLSSVIGFLYLFYYGGFKIWKSAKLY